MIVNNACCNAFSALFWEFLSVIRGKFCSSTLALIASMRAFNFFSEAKRASLDKLMALISLILDFRYSNNAISPKAVVIINPMVAMPAKSFCFLAYFLASTNLASASWARSFCKRNICAWRDFSATASASIFL